MWKLENTSLDPDQLLVNESLFSLANGYLGIRGNFEEGYADSYKTVRRAYLNGFYEMVDVKYTEKLYGFPEIQEKLPNLIDAQSMEIFLDGERATLFKGCHDAFNRVIHFDRGFSERSYEYMTQKGKKASVFIRRMVSMTQKELFLMDVQVIYEGEIKIVSMVNGDVENFTDSFDPRVSAEHAKLIHVRKSIVKDSVMMIEAGTEKSKLKAVCSVVHRWDQDAVKVSNDSCEGSLLIQSYSASGRLHLTKYAVYTDSTHHSDPMDAGFILATRLRNETFDTYLQHQEAYLNAFWAESDIEIQGQPGIQQGVRFNLYQLLQSLGKDGLTNIAAKGLSGEGYEGHYFWDTEIYVLPVLQMLQPEMAKHLQRTFFTAGPTVI